MKKSIRILCLVTLLLCVLGLAFGCKKNDEITYALNKTELEIKQYESFTLRISPDVPDDVQVVWSSADTKVATVNDGVVTGVAVGTTVVNANFGEEKLSCAVSVGKGDVSPTVFLDSNEYSILVKDCISIFPKILLDGQLYDDGEFTIEIEDPTVCSLVENKITGLKLGETNVFIYGKWRAANKAELTKVVKVKVVDDVNLVVHNVGETTPLTEGKVIYTKDIESYNSQIQLEATAYVENEINTTVDIVWEVSNQDLISVDDNGLITANDQGKTGTAFVWAKIDGLGVVSDRVEVKVEYPIIDKTNKVEILVDFTKKSYPLTDEVKDSIFAEDNSQVVKAVYDYDRYGHNTFKNGEVVFDVYSKSGERNWIVLGTTYGVKISSVVADRVITKADDLQVFDELGSQLVKGYFVLGNNIDASGFVPSTHSWASTSGQYGFDGTFNGMGYTIDNLSPISGGLFGSITYAATVKNVAFTNVILKNNSPTLAHTGFGTVENVFIHVKEVVNFKTNNAATGTSTNNDINVLVSQVKGGVYSNIFIYADLVSNEVSGADVKYSYALSAYGSMAGTSGTYINSWGVLSSGRAVAVLTEQLAGFTAYTSHDNSNGYVNAFDAETWGNVNGIPCLKSAIPYFGVNFEE